MSPPNELLIDDLEDGDAAILAVGGRRGSWYIFNDGTVGGSQTPSGPFLPESVQGSDGTIGFAAHTTGQGFTSSGAGLGLDLNASGGTKHPYDASAFTGIKFWIKGTPLVLRVSIPTSATASVAAGGTCVTMCADSTTSVAISSSWKQIAIPFADLAIPPWGAQALWDPTTALSVWFQTTSSSFDFWIDDVTFY